MGARGKSRVCAIHGHGVERMPARLGEKRGDEPQFVRNNCRAGKLDVCIQVLAHGLRELERLNRFGEKVVAFLQ